MVPFTMGRFHILLHPCYFDILKEKIYPLICLKICWLFENYNVIYDAVSVLNVFLCDYFSRCFFFCNFLATSFYLCNTLLCTINSTGDGFLSSGIQLDHLIHMRHHFKMTSISENDVNLLFLCYYYLEKTEQELFCFLKIIVS